MPTTRDEAAKIVSISQEYLPLEKMRELFVRLDEEVGKHTDNDSLKQSLRMMRLLVDPPHEPPPAWVSLAFYLLVFFHMAVVLGVVCSFLILPFKSDWYIALPLMTFVFFFATTRVDCQLTNLENKLRQRMGKKKIGGFVGHYFFRPAKYAWARKPIILVPASLLIMEFITQR